MVVKRKIMRNGIRRSASAQRIVSTANLTYFEDPYGKYFVAGNEKERVYKVLKNKVRAGDTILDLGCGNGYFSYFLAHTFPDAVIVGFDGDREYLLQAQANFSLPNLTFRHVQFSDFSKKNLPRFDYIIFSEVIEHLPNVQEVLVAIRKNLCHRSTTLIVRTDNMFGLLNMASELYRSLRRFKITYLQWYWYKSRHFPWAHHLYSFDVKTLATTLKLAVFPQSIIFMLHTHPSFTQEPFFS